jgi:ubiquinone/menaquinone biosynthesis C-methylase UbiE
MKTTARFVPALGRAWLTPYYDLVVRATTRECLFKQALIDQAGLQPGHRVLDLATGTGTLAIWMKEQHPSLDIAAVDGDPAILAIAARKAARANADIRWAEALSTELPFPPAHFDRIVSSLFFHHLTWDSKVRTAHEVFRVLRPGGELHVADWGRPTGPLMRGLFLTIQLLDGYENTGDNLAGKLPLLFEQAGFSGVRQCQAISTIFGTMALYGAMRPVA